MLLPSLILKMEQLKENICVRCKLKFNSEDFILEKSICIGCLKIREKDAQWSRENYHVR